MRHLKTTIGKLCDNNTELPTVELQSLNNAHTHPPPVISGQQQPVNHLFLPLCLSESLLSSTTNAHQLAVQDVNSDRVLFQIFRTHHKSLRSKWWSWLNLWQVQHIYFVHFQLYEKSLVDVKEHDVVPPEEPNTIYRYERISLRPPIGSNLLTHYFHFSADVPSGTPCLRKIPKVNQELTVCPVQGVCPGWGLQFVEGWNWKKILALLCFLFVLASLLVAVLYWRYHHSIQGSFAIGTFVLACFAASTSTLQAWPSLA